MSGKVKAFDVFAVVREVGGNVVEVHFVGASGKALSELLEIACDSVVQGDADELCEVLCLIGSETPAGPHATGVRFNVEEVPAPARYVADLLERNIDNVFVAQ